MGEIAKGVLGGAWTLLAGWILPTALNLGIFFFAIAPSLRRAGPIAELWPATTAGTMLLLLAGSLLLGLVLSALQNPLYRILEGYLLWPAAAYTHGCGRNRRAKADLQDRLMFLRLERRQQAGRSPLPVAAAADLLRLQANRRISRAARKDRRRTDTQRALLGEKLARFPIADSQITPTRLGNAIRRFEEYGHNRYRLDSQVLWNELTGTAPEQVRRQVDLARAGADFFVALLVGHVALIVSAAVALASAHAHKPALLTTIAVVVGLIPLWYRSAVTATDEWAAAVQALVNLGRKPLAEAFGLRLPPTLDAERTMWALVTRLARRPYHERTAELDPYRGTSPQP
ncbi:hypothetical protein [Streptomyces sp. NBC_00989]|uniref:hypothetical protein n=1 Tax=Streptomyces sp. NBC_00989 TaxID=2903705 RepID=UPI00386ABA4D|nr:hypothetical protein OG714_02040 [Streptomyces sp. NBC_00989]